MLRSVGRLEIVWAVLALLWLLFYLGVPDFGLRGLLQLVLFVLGGVIAIRWMRRLIQKVIWRLRNRLVVAYIFMAVLPTVLLVTLFLTGVWLATWQLALYLVTTEFD